jgi:hypothetical protein
VLVHHFRSTGTVTLPAGWTEVVSQQGSGSTITIADKVAGVTEGADVTVLVSPSRPPDDHHLRIQGTFHRLTARPEGDPSGEYSARSEGARPDPSCDDRLFEASVFLHLACRSGSFGKAWRPTSRRK